jgi:hypothetical protein
MSKKDTDAPKKQIKKDSTFVVSWARLFRFIPAKNQNQKSKKGPFPNKNRPKNH